MKNICIDTGFLYAIYSNRDEIERINKARKFMIDYLKPDETQNFILIAWPILYEGINTKFVKANDKAGLNYFISDLSIFARRKKLVFVDDNPYRTASLNNIKSKLDLSLVDSVLRSILEDRNNHIDAFFTFDQGHFSDICAKRNIELFPY